MVILQILCILSAILNIAIYPLGKISYRQEDAAKLAEGKLRIISETRYSAQACWILSIIILIVALILCDNDVEMAIMMGILCFVAFFICVDAAFHRNSYYTIDEERLTSIKRGIEEWSHPWKEIDHARRRIISTGKAVIVYYDIETKDGVMHRSLPAALEKDLKQRVMMADK